ncbi:MAG: hypothetical protein K6T29_08445, partial [Peptococcaceae bacterium]|nr:hypothetical protein [Peptococcaceae bacterium]
MELIFSTAFATLAACSRTEILFENLKNINMDQIKDALQKIAQKYNLEIARDVERIFRFETNNFKSYVFRKTLGAGALYSERY